jgi:hypothetical protein
MDIDKLNKCLRKDGMNMFLNKAINVEYVSLILQSFNRLFEYQYKFFEIIEMIDENACKRRILDGDQYKC